MPRNPRGGGVSRANGIVPAQTLHRSNLTGTNQMNRVRTTSEDGDLSVTPGAPGIARPGLGHSWSSTSGWAERTGETRARQPAQ
jgi:hypothetical protein